MTTDPFNLERFVSAQAPVWDEVCAELHAGRKRSHWMWFVFPQLAILGRSSMAKHYGLSGLDEARAYLAHTVLGPRLISACAILAGLQSHKADEIFGSVDAMKLRSCLSLFIEAAPEQLVFKQCLLFYFQGDGDPLTMGRASS